MLAVWGDRQAVVARELTKLYETVLRGRLSELIDQLGSKAPKGEIVILVGPGAEAPATAADMDQALIEALSHLSVSDAAGSVAKALGLNRKTVYRRALELKSERASKRGALARKQGHRAEWFAAFWLMWRGWRIVAFRYRTRYGEIDLVARKRDVLAVIEVKRRATLEDALAAVKPAQRHRLLRAATALAAARADCRELY
eukprot:gene19175-24257_t